MGLSNHGFRTPEPWDFLIFANEQSFCICGGDGIANDGLLAGHCEYCSPLIKHWSKISSAKKLINVWKIAVSILAARTSDKV